jgi:hypothetical protein
MAMDSETEMGMDTEMAKAMDSDSEMDSELAMATEMDSGMARAWAGSDSRASQNTTRETNQDTLGNRETGRIHVSGMYSRHPSPGYT